MRCSACSLPLVTDDNYCRRCGASARIIEVPSVASEARSVGVWDDVKPAVTQGVALLAAGAILRYLVGRTAKAALMRALTSGEDGLDPRRIIPFTGGRSSSRNGGEDVEVIWYRRVRR